MEFNKFRLHKVFISSKCDDITKRQYKYTHIRRELQILLEATRLFDVYNYDEDGASASDVVSRYLGEIQDSGIIIFLIDNKDGVPEAVMKERQEAIRWKVKQYYIFCDEFERTPTQLQKEVMSTNQYKVVGEFTKMAELAYTYVMQDIIDTFCRKDPNLANNIQTTAPSNTGSNNGSGSAHQNIHVIAGNHGINKKYCESSDNLKKYVWNLMVGNSMPDVKDDRIYDFGRLLLDNVLCLKDFDTESFHELKRYILSIQDRHLHDILEERFKTIECYYRRDMAGALKHTRQALSIALGITDAAPDSEHVQASCSAWLIYDIAIDLRNLAIIEARDNGSVSFGEDGQNILDGADDFVHFPVLDRLVADGNKKVIEEYEKNYSRSPYTVIIASNLSSIADNYVDAFWLAVCFGSFTHIQQIMLHISDVLKMLINIYEDHIPVMQLIRFTCVAGTDIRKNLDYIERTYHAEPDLLSASEALSVYDSIQRVPEKYIRLSAQILFLSRFGYYMDDSTFDSASKDIISASMSWISDDSRDYRYGAMFIEFYQRLAGRGIINSLIDFGTALLETGIEAYITDMCDKYRYVGYYREADENKISDFVSSLLECADRMQNAHNALELIAHLVIAFPFLNEKAAPEINRISPGFYKSVYCVKMMMNGISKTDDTFTVLEEDFSEIRQRRKNLAKGLTVWPVYNPYSRVLEITRQFGDVYNNDQIENILRFIREALEDQNESIANKVYCCEIIGLLLRRYNDHFDSETTYENLIRNMSRNLVCSSQFFSNDEQPELEYAYVLMLLDCKPRFVGKANDILLLSNRSSDYLIIQLLRITNDFLESDKDCKAGQTLVDGFYRYAMTVGQANDKEIQAQCVKCLAKLSCYKDMRTLSLSGLWHFMNSGNARIRMMTVAYLNQLEKKNDIYSRLIIKKAESDHNYMVRKTAGV